MKKYNYIRLKSSCLLKVLSLFYYPLMLFLFPSNFTYKLFVLIKKNLFSENNHLFSGKKRRNFTGII